MWIDFWPFEQIKSHIDLVLHFCFSTKLIFSFLPSEVQIGFLIRLVYMVNVNQKYSLNAILSCENYQTILVHTQLSLFDATRCLMLQ